MNNAGDDERDLLMAALREKARAMSATEWNTFVMQTRPPDLSQLTDPADRNRAVLASITAKQRLRPKVDANGHPLKKGSTQ